VIVRALTSVAQMVVVVSVNHLNLLIQGALVDLLLLIASWLLVPSPSVMLLEQFAPIIIVVDVKLFGL